MIRNRNKCLLSKAVVDRESIWSNLFLSRSRCQLFIPTGGRAAFLIKEKEGGLRTYKEMKHTKGCKGKTKTDTADQSLKQNSKELCVVLLVPNRSMLES